MLKVKTILKESSIHGIGLFADQLIPKDTIIFEEDEFTIKFSQNDIINFTPTQMAFINTYCYVRNGLWYCSIDNDRFTNHSDNPNVYETETATWALRDIQKGEEILTDYRSICDDYTIELIRPFCS